MRVYRNVTLAGLGRGTLGATPSAGTGATPGAPSEGSSGVATQLDVGHRRNVFGLADGDAAVLVFADMNVVNPPPGPPDTWPWGLTSGGMWHVGLNRWAAGGRGGAGGSSLGVVGSGFGNRPPLCLAGTTPKLGGVAT